jgi:ribosomal protein S18 acetylase RimI-like enzyme
VRNPAEYSAAAVTTFDAAHSTGSKVATAARGRKIGTQVVQMLAERHRDRRLFAYSQDADRFWARLSWDRFDHPDGDWRALFIQPLR